MITSRTITKLAKPGSAAERYASDPRMATVYWAGVEDGQSGGPCLPPPAFSTSGAPRTEPERCAWYDGWKDGDRERREGR